jgi:RNA polymerase sigma-70 factor (ECF subfamily)
MDDWNEIVRKNAGQVLNSAYRILGNVSDAEDISQEVFSEAFRKWQVAPDQKWSGHYVGCQFAVRLICFDPIDQAN